jgi:hypothetical protein
MSNRCAGKRPGGRKCKTKVPEAGDYCHYHEDQRVKGPLCNCYLDSGSSCPYPASSTGFCEFHVNPVQCYGKTLLGDRCSRFIPTGRYCSRCRCQEDIIDDKVKSNADATRAILIKQGGAIYPNGRKTMMVSMMSDRNYLNIPETLKKVELSKPEECGICYEPMENSKAFPYRQLTCGHYFHLECVSKTFRMDCPMCRTPITVGRLPAWVTMRIEDNINRSKKQEAQVNFESIMEEYGEDMYEEPEDSEEQDADEYMFQQALLASVGDA